MASLKRDRDENDNDNDDGNGQQQKPLIIPHREDRMKEKQEADDAASKAQNGDFVNPKDGKVEFAVLQPSYLNDSIDGQTSLHDRLVRFFEKQFHNNEEGEHRHTRSACDQTNRNDAKIVNMNHKYGSEFYVQTEEFDRRCQEKDPKYVRIPADQTKHSIPKQYTPWLEKHDSFGPLRELCAFIDQEELLDGEKLCLIQCVHYNADAPGDRGRHIDNVMNGGKIIVGVTLGDKPLSECKDDTSRYRNISLDLKNEASFTKILPPGSMYVMKGQCREEYHHDARKPAGSSHYVIMLRYGKAL